MVEPILSTAAAPGNVSLLDVALEYTRRGWCILPVLRGTKISAVPWTRYQTARPSHRCLSNWFNRPDVGGLAVVCGAISGNVCCRDFDEPGAYDRWAAAQPELAVTLPTAQTSPGRYHVWFTTAAEVYRDKTDLLDGELRGDSKHYCLLPPSIHPDGPVYRWLIPLPDGPLPLIDPIDAGLVPAPRCLLPGGQYHPNACVNSSTLPPCNISHSALREAVRQTIPTGPGQRNRRLWDLARLLKSVPEFRRVKAEELEPYVLDWWASALPVIRKKDWSRTWADWTSIWPRVRPWGATLHGIGSAVQAMAPGRDVEACLARLELVAEELDRRHEGRPFPLGARVAGRLIGTSHTWAARLVKRLVRGGILEIAVEFDRKAKKAREYKYAGPRILHLVTGEKA